MVKIVEDENRIKNEKVAKIKNIFEEAGFICSNNSYCNICDLYKDGVKIAYYMYFIGITIWGSAEVFLPVAEKLEENGFEVTIKY